VINSIDADGTRAGYDLELLRAVSDVVSVPVIASGGAGTLHHMLEAVTIGRADAALAASIFHFGTYSITQAKTYFAEHGVPVRTT
jgi:cyclase